MLCGPDSDDPLAAELFKTEQLNLLLTAHDPQELHPGSLIRVTPDKNRSPLVARLASLVSGATVDLSSAPYVRLNRSLKSNRLSLEAAARLSAVLGTDESVDKATLNAAIASSGCSGVKIALAGGTRITLDEAEFENSLLAASLTDLGEHYVVSEANTLFLVTETILANRVVIELRSEANLDLTALASLAAKAEGVLGLKKGTAKTCTIEMSSQSQRYVIGFKAVQIETAGGRLQLKGQARRLRMRGSGKSPPTAEDYAPITAFSSDGTIFVSLQDDNRG